MKDKFPKPGEVVLILEGGSSIPISATYKPENGKYRQWEEICNCDCGDGKGSGFYQEEITHWMPLPKPPGDDELHE